MTDKLKPIEVTDKKKLPTVYIVFPDNLDEVMKIIEKKEEKLIQRGYKFKRPYGIYRYTEDHNEYTHSKRKTVVTNRKPYTELVFELEKI